MVGQDFAGFHGDRQEVYSLFGANDAHILVFALGETLVAVISRDEEEEEAFILMDSLPESGIAAGYSQKPEPEIVKGQIIKKVAVVSVEQLNPDIDANIHSFSIVFIIDLQKHLQDIAVISYWIIFDVPIQYSITD